jgi:hypothetical protein
MIVGGDPIHVNSYINGSHTETPGMSGAISSTNFSGSSVISTLVDVTPPLLKNRGIKRGIFSDRLR